MAQAATVTVTIVGAAGLVVAAKVVVVAAVVVGVAYVGYQGYQYFKIPRRIRAAANQVGVSARALGDAVEQFKRDNGLPPNHNLDWQTILAIAEALKRGEYYSK
jgi:hypothetical protein